MDSVLKVLLLEESESDALLIAQALQTASLSSDVRRVENLPDLVRELQDFAPDIVLSEYFNHEAGGQSALDAVRAKGADVPFIFVSGTIGEERAIELLQRGATDYVLKSNLARLGTAVVRALRERNERIARTRAEAELRMLSRRLMRAQENERAIISRELHDEIGQTFTALKIHLQNAERALRLPAARAHLKECVRIADQALEEVRALSMDLRPPQLDDFGLIPALRSHLLRIPKLDGLELVLQANREDMRIDADVEAACFRIVQEAFTNVLRHANARHAGIDVQFNPNEIVVHVRDDGCGFDPECPVAAAPRRHPMGLLGMRERARLLGGRLNIVSARGAGTDIVASFPLPPERRATPR